MALELRAEPIAQRGVFCPKSVCLSAQSSRDPEVTDSLSDADTQSELGMSQRATAKALEYHIKPVVRNLTRPAAGPGLVSALL